MAVSGSGPLDVLRAVEAALPPKAGRIAQVVLTRPMDVVHMSVTELALAAGASEGSVVALCQYIGMRGFQALKLALARELVQPIQFIHEDVIRDDDARSVVNKVFASSLQALQDTHRILDVKALTQAVDLIRVAERVEVYGIGSAAPIAEDASYCLTRIGIQSKAVVDSHVQAISASLTNARVATITISHSGATHETLTAVRLAKQAGARTICITGFGRSPILAHADVVLQTLSRETQFRTEAMASRIAQIAIIDALVASVALATYERSVDTIARCADILAGKRL